MAIGRQFIISLIANVDSVSDAFKKVGESVGRITKPMAIATAAVTAGFTAISAAIFKVGSDLVNLGGEFNNAYGIIRTQTGAVGKEFERLQQSFRNIAGTVGNPFADVATALAEVDSRMDLLSSKRVERVSKQFLDLAEITGGDLTTTIRDVSRMINRFDIEAGDVSRTLDFMFRVTQTTGVSVDQLATQTTQFANELGLLGFDLQESIVFLGMLEREGKNAGDMLPALNNAARNLAKEGVKDINVGIAEFIDELRTLDQTAGEQRAAEILGKNWRDFYNLVVDNNLNYGELISSLEKSTITISGVADETDTLAESWQEFKNFLMLELEGPATAVFTGLKATIEELRPAAERVKEAYSKDGLAGALDQVQLEWNRIYDEHIEPLWTEFTTFLRETVLPLAVEIGAEIGMGIANAIWNAFKEKMRGFFWSEEIAAAVGGIDVQGEINRQLGLPAPRSGPMPTFTVPNPGTPIPAPSSLLGRRGGGRVSVMGGGGIVTSPTLSIIGERGPEAVIPLDRMPQAGGNVFNITVTSADPNAVVDAIRRYTRSNGPLGQVVAV